MKTAIRILTAFLLTIFFSCEQGDLFRRCEGCMTEEPTDAEVEFRLTPFTSSNYSTKISIYEGNIEDSILLQNFETTSANWTSMMTINKKYTLVAKYYINGKFYEVINSVTPGVQFEKFLCVNPCYRITDSQCDLRLKYQ
jgi:ABC-type uncharacterized transport system fused permease/ATPase subunit